MRESNWMRQAMLRLSALRNVKVFRVNVGMAWTSEQKAIKLENGDVLLKNARPFRSGVPKGFHDLIGIRRTKITENMVGLEIGQFFSVETKTEKGRPTKEQLAFQQTIRSLGGISIIARPDADLEEIFGD